MPQRVWHEQDLTALTGAPDALLAGITAYLSPSDATQHLLYVKTQGHIEGLWHDGTGWRQEPQGSELTY